VTGLTASEAEARLNEHGPNMIAADGSKSIGLLVWHAVINPLVLLLGVLATISFSTGDSRAGVVMSLMIALGVGLRLIQERRADTTAAKLKAMISVTATTLRDGQPQELPMGQLVPGDVVTLAAGDMIPADVRIVTAKDLFIIQSSLTDESFPVEKFELDQGRSERSPIELANLAFLGTSVESGAATAVVAATGRQTYLGSMAESLAEQPNETAFDKGVARFTWLMVRFILVMVPVVFLINGLTKGRWHDAFFFALAVAVGLTPEMLPMIVTVCLSKGAMAMARKKVIVKRLNAIQNLGAMDVLCTDKTGTLTRDHVIQSSHCDVALKPDNGVLALAYLNSHFQRGL
jgi:Mg2+-importing ATPase